MADFLGTLKGTLVQKQKKNEPERVVAEGNRRTGMLTQTASWEGAIQVKAYYNRKRKEDWVRISKILWYGEGIEREIYHGPIGVESNG